MILGANVGTYEIPANVKTWAAELAKEFYAAQVADYFSEPVDVDSLPRGAGFDDVRSRVLLLAGRPIGWRVEVVMTTGVDKHTDNTNGISVCLTLHGKGFKFKNGKGKARVCDAGDLMYFDDSVPHSMQEPKTSDAVWVGLVCKV